MQTEMYGGAISPFHVSMTERMVHEKVEHLWREVKKLETLATDHRICTALQDAALMLKTRLALIKKETMTAQRDYFESDETEFDNDEYDRH